MTDSPTPLRPTAVLRSSPGHFVTFALGVTVLFPGWLGAVGLSPLAQVLTHMGPARLFFLLPIGVFHLMLASRPPLAGDDGAWQAWGTAHGATSTPGPSIGRGGEWTSPSGLSGTMEGHAYRLEVISLGPRQAAHTRLRITLDRRAAFQFSIQPRNALTSLMQSDWLKGQVRASLRAQAGKQGLGETAGDWFVDGDVTGVPGGFDGKYIVKSDAPEYARKFLSDEGVQHALGELEAVGSWNSWTLYDTGQGGATAELSLEVQGRASGTGQLEAMWSAQVAAVLALARLGVAAQRAA